VNGNLAIVEISSEWDYWTFSSGGKWET